jgi:hypothetical protein
MARRFIKTIFILLFVQIGLSAAQEKTNQDDLLQDQAIKVFLDVSRYYQEYIKTEIPFVNYVRDRKQAQVYILMTYAQTGAGGYEYTMNLIGQKDFQSVNDTVKYVSIQSQAREITRAGIVKALKFGLMRYVEKTPLADYIGISYRRKSSSADVTDKWDFWVFNVDTDTDISGEESRNRLSADASFSADRVTPDSKIALRIRGEYNERNDELDEGWDKTVTRSQNFRGLYVKSLSDHWSLGGNINVSASTYRNLHSLYEIGPAIEFNVFPYSQYTRREFRFLYKTNINSVNYVEETIYNKMEENLFYHSLQTTFELKERWGSLETSLEGSHFLHDFSKRRLEFSCNLNFRLIEGLSINVRGIASMIQDQLALRKSEVDEKDILLRRREIATNFDYYVSFGFRYTFGSIYSNVVNPRFGNGRRGFFRRF